MEYAIYTREMLAAAIEALALPDPKMRRDGAHRLGIAASLLEGGIFLNWMRESDDFSLLACEEDFGDTVGVAVTPGHFKMIREANGFQPLAEVPPDQDAMEFELHFEAVGKEEDDDWLPALRLDILTTRDPAGNGAIAKFLAKHGEGIQQIEHEVSDVDHATRILVKRFGQKPIYPATRAGANGTRVNFFLVPTGHENQKVLIELVEAAKAK